MSDSIILALVCAACVIIAANPCLARSTGWPPLGAKEKTYYLENSYKENWFGAYTACFQNNSRLARVENREENEKILELIENSKTKKQNYWIGASDLGREGHWSWLLTGQPVEGFTYWYDGEPNDTNQKEDCLSYGLPGTDRHKWNDEECALPRYFICESYDSSSDSP